MCVQRGRGPCSKQQATRNAHTYLELGTVDVSLEIVVVIDGRPVNIRDLWSQTDGQFSRTIERRGIQQTHLSVKRQTQQSNHHTHPSDGQEGIVADAAQPAFEQLLVAAASPTALASLDASVPTLPPALPPRILHQPICGCV